MAAIPGLLRQALESFRNNDIPKALSLYNTVLKYDPVQKDALNNMAVILILTEKLDQAAELYSRLLTIDPNNSDALANYGILLRKQKKYEEAKESLEKAIALAPVKSGHSLNLGLLLLDMQNYPASAGYLKRELQITPNSIRALCNLTRVLNQLGRTKEALNYGLRALKIKNEESLGQKNKESLKTYQLPKFVPSKPERNAIAFSLWGALPRYTQGAIENAMLVPKIYPGWTARFYCDASVPEEVRAKLIALGAKVIKTTMHQGHEGIFWRMLVNDDPSVDYFLCRDCDSRINMKEQSAVNEWLASGKPFHLMRDAPFHTELVMCGMWGGVTNVLPPIKPMIEAFLAGPIDQWIGIDQDFMRVCIWPLIYEHALTHDTYYRFGTFAKDFPQEYRLEPPLHVGAGIL